ncbi:hypothetical protein GHK92_05900 [Nocardioides sp. dk4132]|uniref:hypothetical protein n=1 Tax=unclassified Nocardioides TaxID=2615069 RepID=UPI0012955269|nr:MULTISPECIES: hypothetical protein [unclassified Nocardioides]MQW75400.1 hypothetical protein [Nocardioides sp. dk4132]
MKVNSKIGVIWAAVVFVVIGLVLVLVATLNGGDDNDQEKQPASIGVVAPAVDAGSV